MAISPVILKTFIHVSDLHIGEIDPQSGDALVSPGTNSFIQQFKYLDGILGHHGQALKDLQAFCEEFTRRGEAFELLVSGDFTRCGSVKEIATVKRFLAGSIDLSPPNGLLVGLQLGLMPAASITGNHDQWGGVNHPWGGGPLNARALAPNSMPFLLTYPLANGRRLLLAGIDTDADIKSRSIKRVLAQGSFQNQLIALKQRLPRAEAEDIRVLIAHHSMACHSLTLRMDDASWKALGAFLADHQFSILLSGHTHAEEFNKIPITASNGSAADIVELTCGTTTQHDQVPYNWRNIFGSYPTRNWPENTLFVHRILGTPGATTWECQAYGRGPSGFCDLGIKHKRKIAL
jgi:hypothetical protein